MVPVSKVGPPVVPLNEKVVSYAHCGGILTMYVIPLKPVNVLITLRQRLVTRHLLCVMFGIL